MLSVEHLFLAGLGFDIAGGYLVSRGLLASVPQLATKGGTVYALERAHAGHAIEDRIRGTWGLVSLVLGFALQAIGYALVLRRAPVHYGTSAAAWGLAIAATIAIAIPVLERSLRPRRRRQ